MKQLFFTAAFMLGFMRISAAEIELSSFPNYPVEGESFAVILSAEKALSLAQDPPKIEGCDFQTTKSGLSKETGKYLFILWYNAGRSGRLIIPPFKIRTQNKITETTPAYIKVWSSNPSVPADKVILTNVKFNGTDKMPEKVYPGIIFDVDYIVSTAIGWEASTDSHTHNDFIPRINPGGLNVKIQEITKTTKTGFFTSTTRRSSYYGIEEKKELIGGILYNTAVYNFKIVPVKSGDYTLKITHLAAASKPKRGLPGRDQKKVPVAIEKIVKVTPLPASPKGLNFLEIAGKFKIKGLVNKRKVKTGHTFELAVKVEASEGDLGRIKAPQLKIPGIEVDRIADISGNSDVKIIKYSMRALRPDASLSTIEFATFDPKTESFVKHPVSPYIVFTGEALDVPGKTNNSEPVSDKNSLAELKTELANVSRPLHFNISPVWYFVSLLMPLIFLILTYILSVEKTAADPKKEARKKLQELCRRLNGGTDIRDIEAELIPALAGYLNLPPGMTADELADRIDDRELATLLKDFSHDSFSPGSSADNTGYNQLTLKLKSLLLLSFFFIMPLRANQTEAGEKYLEADFIQSEVLFEKLTEKNNSNPNHFYNLGLTRLELNKPAAALASFETALRLSPSDQEIKQKIFEIKKALKVNNDNGLIAVRDQVRPDQWIKTSLTVWCLMWVVLLIQLLVKNPGKRWTGLFGTVIVCLCFAAAVTQESSTYQEGQYIVDANATAYINASLKDKSPVELTTGQKITAKAFKGKTWIRTEVNGEEVWLRSRDLIKFW